MMNPWPMLAALVLAIARPAVPQDVAISADCGALQITGSFSSLHYDDEKHGLLGAEIRIVATEDGYQASLQMADGKLSDLFVADVEFDTDLRYWPLGVPLPEREPGTDQLEMRISQGPYAGLFNGKVTKTEIIGELRLRSGTVISLRVPRRKGYWD